MDQLKIQMYLLHQVVFLRDTPFKYGSSAVDSFFGLILQFDVQCMPSFWLKAHLVGAKILFYICQTGIFGIPVNK